MAVITQVGHADANGANLAALSMTSHTAGNVLVLGMVTATTAANISITGVTGGGSTNWAKIRAISGASVYGHAEIWAGTVTSATASSLGVTHTTTAVSVDLSCDEFSRDMSGTGVAASANVWVGSVSGVLNNSTGSTSVTYPTLTSPNPGDALYFGIAHTNGTASATSATGVALGDQGSYKVTALPHEYVWIADCSDNTAEKPVGTQATAVTSRTIAAIIKTNPFSKVLTPTAAVTLSSDFESVGKVLSPSVTSAVTTAKQTAKKLIAYVRRDLSFPGTDNTDPGVHVNKISPYFTAASTSLTVVLTTGPSDNGNLGAYGADGSNPNTGGDGSAPPGTYTFAVNAGVLYFIYSYKGGTYRSGLSGEGIYLDPVRPVATFARQAGKTLAASVGTVAVLRRQAGKVYAVTVGTAVTTVKGIGHLFSVSVGSVAARVAGVGKTLGGTVTGLADQDLQAGKTLSGQVGSSVASSKGVGKSLSASVSVLASLVSHATTTYQLVLSCAVTPVASWTRRLVLNPVVCAVLSLTAKACDTLGLSTASDTIIALAAKVDTTVTATPATDDSLTATPVND